MDRANFVLTNGLKLDKWEDSPPDALERDLVKFRYNQLNFNHAIPTMLLSLSTIAVGFGALLSNSASDSKSVGFWLLTGSIISLVGNGQKRNTFTGNFGDVCMQFGTIQAALVACNSYN